MPVKKYHERLATSIKLSAYFFLWIIFIASCSHSFGLYTSKIEGKITNYASLQDKRGFVLVVFKQRSFIELAQKPLYVTKSLLLPIDATGRYFFYPGASLSEANFYIFFAKHIIINDHFNQTIGQGNINISKKMVPAEEWENYYYFSVKPLLSAFTNNDDYRLGQAERVYVLDWLLEVEEELSK
ncbi:MAG: hypothetical protein JJV97_00830 [SAR324 cluster bacterium]|nr:hypothetical protein [SAR324 cluster bacterium]